MYSSVDKFVDVFQIQMLVVLLLYGCTSLFVMDRLRREIRWVKGKYFTIPFTIVTVMKIN